MFDKKQLLLAVSELWLTLPLRYMVLNLSRFTHYCEKGIRLHMEQCFDFVAFKYPTY